MSESADDIFTESFTGGSSDSREWSQVHFEAAAAGAGKIPNLSIMALTPPQGDEDKKNVNVKGPGMYRLLLCGGWSKFFLLKRKS